MNTSLLIDTLKYKKFINNSIENSNEENIIISPFKPVNKDFILFNENNIITYKIKKNYYNNELKKKSIKFDSFQQSFLIYKLLENNYEINISKLYKKGNIQLFKIKTIKKDNLYYYNENENIEIIKDLKRIRKILDNLSNNKMIDILENLNYKFDLKNYNNDNNQKMKRIKNIYFNNELIYNKNSILEIGEQIHNIIINKIKKFDYNFNKPIII